MASTLKIRRSGGWVSIPDGQVYIRSNRVWVSPTKIYIKRGGVWVDTGFHGRPNTPVLSLYADDYTHIQVTVTAPGSGVPSTALRVYLLNSSGGYLQGTDYSSGPGGTVNPNFAGLSIDTNYIVRAWTIGAGGVLSNPVEIHRRTGHPEQGYNQANYGWGGENTATPAQIDGTSEYEYGGHPGALAVDNNSTTKWVSGAFADPSSFAALVFQPAGGNRLLTRVVALTDYGPDAENGYSTASSYQYSYCGIWINGSLVYDVGPIGGGGAVTRTWFVESYGYNLQNVTQFNVANTNLVPWPLSYRAEIAEVWYAYRDWVIVSYTWIVTVAAAGNSTW